MADIKENPKEKVELSQEELTAKRDEITNYYKDHIPHLEAQLEYENLLRDIEKCRAERMQAQMYMTKMAATPPEAGVNTSKAPPVPNVQGPKRPSPEEMKNFQNAARQQQPIITDLKPVEEIKKVADTKIKRTLKKSKTNG